MSMTPVAQPHHLSRKAVVYIRQSTGHQVLTNIESQQLQHAMREHARHLGWPEERIEVVETDLGRSAQSTAGRDGYKALLADVALGQVGIVLSYESTRLSRNCTDWYPLLDLCAYNQCLIADRDGVYDAATPNGRLLLGMKGIVSEVELHTLRGRLIAGVQQKAQRGELALALPAGLLRHEDGRVVKDPDRAVQHALTLVFQTFLARKAASQVVRLLRDQGLRLPRRHRNCETVWRTPTVAAVIAIIRNPAYAGTLVYGKTRMQAQPGSGRPQQRRLRALWAQDDGAVQGWESVSVSLSPVAGARPGVPTAPRRPRGPAGRRRLFRRLGPSGTRPLCAGPGAAPAAAGGTRSGPALQRAAAGICGGSGASSRRAGRFRLPARGRGTRTAVGSRLAGLTRGARTLRASPPRARGRPGHDATTRAARGLQHVGALAAHALAPGHLEPSPTQSAVALSHRQSGPASCHTRYDHHPHCVAGWRRQRVGGAMHRGHAARRHGLCPDGSRGVASGDPGAIRCGYCPALNRERVSLSPATPCARQYGQNDSPAARASPSLPGTPPPTRSALLDGPADCRGSGGQTSLGVPSDQPRPDRGQPG